MSIVDTRTSADRTDPAALVRPVELIDLDYADPATLKSREGAAVFAHPEFDAHERVILATDATSGRQAIIAVHSTRLGPAGGGCRMWP